MLLNPRPLRLLGSAVLLGVGHPAGAQDARLIASGPPDAELPYEFSQISQVYELRDGRVVVLDRLEGNVRLANLRTGVSSVVGRTGDGPGEYRGATVLIPLGGDSVGVIDNANPRILVITSEGVVAGFVSPYAKHPDTPVTLTPRHGDGRGWFYGETAVTQRSGGQLQYTDSASILRWKVGAESAEIASRIFRAPPPGSTITSTGHLVHRPGAVPALSPSTTWIAGADGRIAVVSGAPYQVMIIEPGGSRRLGPVIPFARVAVNDSVKNAYQSDASRPQMTVVVDRGTGATGTIRSVPPMFRISNWAPEVPPFLGGAFVAFAPNGLLWIQRTTFRREGGRYDVIGRDGALVDRVQLPESHRVVGFGRDVMYVVRRDADDLEYLQRRALPR